MTASSSTPTPAPAGTRLAGYQITKGTRVAVQLRNGRRVSGKAMGRIQDSKAGAYFTLNKIMKRGAERIDMADVDHMISLG